jgi:DNA-binding response OmpR family regulator
MAQYASNSYQESVMDHPTSHRRILLVEDDETLRQSVARTLSAHGHTVSEAADFEAAKAFLEREQPDVLILDINLPDATGWDVLREGTIKPETTVIMLTGTPVSPKRLAEFRPAAYLPKPFPLAALLRLIDRAGQREEDTDET